MNYRIGIAQVAYAYLNKWDSLGHRLLVIVSNASVSTLDLAKREKKEKKKSNKINTRSSIQDNAHRIATWAA